MLAMKIDDWMPIIFVAGLTAIAWGITRMRYRKRSGSQSASETVSMTKPSELAAMSKEISALVVELEETGRRIAAQIDNRYQRLDALLAEAEEKISRLEKLKNELGIDSAELPSQSANQPTWPPAPTSLPAASTTPPPKYEPDPQHVAVYALADRGKTSREIAQEIGKQPGEVELILALRGGR
jgi:hypothetical protein